MQASELGLFKQAVTVSRVAEMSLQVLEGHDSLESPPMDIGRLSESLNEHIIFNMVNQPVVICYF